MENLKGLWVCVFHRHTLNIEKQRGGELFGTRHEEISEYAEYVTDCFIKADTLKRNYFRESVQA
ncbi:hypothetical protein RY280_23485 [Bacillus paralicheniformis]|uniref:hypothetical protein n=1 Tax=Bacillus paralicheniformis TaxID=1648923 RepID=UPI00203EB3E6|nr:hypothetical protein [Bacillus paralicheniformis]MCM3425597.1 hypothetical protein [Bacillus paralicheniformis]